MKSFLTNLTLLGVIDVLLNNLFDHKAVYVNFFIKKIVSRYTLTVAASNLCEQPPVPDSVSSDEKMTITLYIQDVNDVAPRFIDGFRTAGIMVEDTNNKMILRLQVVHQVKKKH